MYLNQGCSAMKTPESLRHLRIAIILVLGVLVLGTVGYMLIEQLSFVDALYTTVNMIATVGDVVYPLSQLGRMFTIVVIVLGVGALLYTFGVGMEFMIEGQLSQVIRRRFMQNKIAVLRNHYIVCGYGRVGLQIAEEFAAARIPFVVIDEKENNVGNCIERGYLALQGDATSDDILHEAGIRYAKCLLVATDNDAHNISITLSARHLNSKLFIVARANHNETEAKLKLAGADRVLSPYTIGGHRMANLALQPGVMEFFDTITKAGDVELGVQEVVVPASSPLVSKTLVEAQNTLSYGTMLIALKRPSGVMAGSRLEARIEVGDTVIVVGAAERLAVFKRRNI
jgi:voltage-gated potassium channel